MPKEPFHVLVHVRRHHQLAGGLIRRSAAAVGALSLVLFVGACGSGAVPGITKKSEPKAWAKDVCTAIVPWSTDLGKTLADFGDDIDQSADPGKVKTDYDATLAKAEKSTDKAIEGLDDAGEPDVKDGDKIAKEFNSSLENAKKAFSKARKDVKALDTGDKEKFYTELGKVSTQLGKDIESSGNKLEKISSPELDKVFDNEAACKNEN